MASAEIDSGCGNDWLHFWKAQPAVASMAWIHYGG
jgi:hypothetical protein